MKQKRYSKDQMAYALRQAENGEKVVEICRKMATSERTFLSGKKSPG